MTVHRNPLLPFILAGLSLLGTAYLGLTGNDRSTAQRLSAVEAHQDDTTQRLDRIEVKLDSLLEQVLKVK